MQEYVDKIYEEAFEAAYANMMWQKANDPAFTRAYLLGLLESLYVEQGNNQLGRSEVKEAAKSATIAACELILAEWEQAHRAS